MQGNITIQPLSCTLWFGSLAPRLLCRDAPWSPVVFLSRQGLKFIMYLVLTQKVSDFFVIDLNEWAPDQNLQLVIRSSLRVHNLKNVIKHIWHDPPLSNYVGMGANHCVRLATPCLAISKYSSIVAGERAFHNTESSLTVHILLSRVFIENCIVAERFIFSGVTFSRNRHLVRVLVHNHTGAVILFYFWL